MSEYLLIVGLCFMTFIVIVIGYYWARAEIELFDLKVLEHQRRFFEFLEAKFRET